MIGKSILHYIILEKLGEGGMGVVYKAEDLKLKREVAIKFLPRYISSSDEERQRFEIEAQAAASLNHPNITTIHSIEEVNDDIFIVMEYIDGFELKEKIKSGTIKTEEVINIATQIAEGLEAAHKKGIVHRDIKSQNIMISNDSKVRIMDFGLAKIGKGLQLTKIGSTVGTIAYMSPEQTRGDELDYRTDIWSFGIVLYEMLTGKMPFKGDYDQAVIYSILNEEPELAGLPSGLNSIIGKALSKEKENRYQDISKMLGDLIEFKNGSTSGKYNQSLKNIIRTKKENKKWFVPIVVLIIIIFIAALYIYYTGESKEAEASLARKMIVVLPFENLGSSEDEYFADGITEEITSRLSSLSGLGVIARTSAMQYKRKDKSLDEVSKELGVSYVLAGTVRWERTREGKSVKVNPELIRTSDGVQIWSEPFEAPYSSSFKLQSQIAYQVANAMDINLLQPEKKSLSTNLTENQEAYTFYLKGIDFLENRSQGYEKSKSAENLFKQALKLDPNFAAAYGGLSRVYSDMYWFYYDHTEERVKQSKDAADKAFLLNPEPYYVYTALAYYYYHCELNYVKALENFHHSLKLQPNDADAMLGVAAVLRRQGKIEESISFFQKAGNINPLSAQNIFEIGITYFWLKRYDKAELFLQKAKNLDPGSGETYYYLSACYILSKGDLNKARKILDEVKNWAADNTDNFFKGQVEIDIYERKYSNALNRLKKIELTAINDQHYFIPKDFFAGIINLYDGKTAEAKKLFNSTAILLNKKIKESPNDSRFYSALGLVYAGLDKKDEAIREGKLGVELLPMNKEALGGFYREFDMVKIYIMVGEFELAIDKLDYLLSAPGELSISSVKLDPMFDPIRKLPEYKTLIKKYSFNE
jgi:serine/threonine protein kinase/Flp pilus assembly protein TadD